MLFFVVFFSYLLVLESLNWLVLTPLAWLRPTRRRDLIGTWLRLQTRIALGLARGLAGVRLVIRGKIEPTSCVVLMNHQSIFDILVGLSLVRGPYPLIPARASYAFGVPGISSMIRLMRCPLLTQRPIPPRSELLALREAADQVARGEQSLLIYPEGHRSPDGAMLPFMKPGLRLILRRTRERPVYFVVVDGFAHLRLFRDTALRLAGTTGRVEVLGPYNTPAGDVELEAFLDSAWDRMALALALLRRGAPEPQSVDS